jgi:spore maturation protein A
MSPVVIRTPGGAFYARSALSGRRVMAPYNRDAPMNTIFAALFVVALAFAALTGNPQGFSSGLFKGVADAVEVAIGLTGALAFWLGLVRILERAGALAALSRGIGPVIRRLFPEVPAEHPALAAMTMNIAANMLGLGNAATPFGIKAMEELDKLNPRRGVASDAQALFLAINTANVTLVPATVIALRAKAGAAQPADVLLPGLIASLAATVAAILGSRLLSRLGRYRAELEAAESKPTPGAG